MDNQVGKMKCFHPQTINDNVVSCGRCYACKKNRISGWVCRLERHSRHAESAIFVTLTYADGQATKTNNNLLTLDYTHIQHYFKTLRNLHNADYKKRIKCAHANNRKKNPAIGGAIADIKRPKKFSYYVAGEYGTKGLRPHYHIILFNAKHELIPLAWSIGDKARRHPRGHVHTGNITGGAIRYTLKYISKPSRLPLFQGDDRTPEFSHMSQGIGKSYITEKIIAWHKADLLNRYYVPNAGGVQTTMPRYYAEKIYTLAERMLIAEHLEKQQSDNFYKAILKDESVIHSVFLIHKNLEAKAFQKIEHKL